MKTFKFGKLLKCSVLWLLCFAMMASTVYAAKADTDTASHIIPFQEPPVTDAPAETPSASDSSVEPVVIKVGNMMQMQAQFADYYYHPSNSLTSGNYASGKEEDGTTYMRLTYAAPTEASHPEYRIMPKFLKGSPLTEKHKYMRVTFKTNDTFPAELILLNNVNTRGHITLMSDCSVSKGEWTRTNPVMISNYDCLGRFLSLKHCTLGFYNANENAEYYISEIAFFESEQQAYDYYKDSALSDAASYTKLSFSDGSGTTFNGDTYGANAFNKSSQALDITYAETTNVKGTNGACVSYLAKIKFNGRSSYTADQRYIRVLYSAKNPEGVTGASFYMRDDAHYNTVKLVDNIQDTNGKYVLSDTKVFHKYTANRFAGTGQATQILHNSFFINTNKPGGLYSIKAIYFFSDRKAADAFNLVDGNCSLTINGNDIAKYQIVIADADVARTTNAANTIVKRVQDLTGVVLPIVKDIEPVSEYEILIGESNREKSDFSLYSDLLSDNKHAGYAILTDEKTLVLTSELAATLEPLAEYFNKSYLFSESTTPPKEIALDNVKFVGNTVADIDTTEYYGKVYENIADPVRFTDDFDSDDNYFMEHNNTSNWNIADGVISAKAGERVLTYLHVYEPNATFGAKMKFTNAGKNGDIGLMLRYNSADAWVKAGYDFAKGEWYIENRQGADFYLERNASKKATVTPNTWYDISFTVDKYSASLSVNGEVILTADGIGHKTPGKIAFFAQDITATFDDADILLLSGEGVILPGAHHAYLWDNRWLAGGTVFETNDGLIRYMYGTNLNLKSYDGGITWVNSESFCNTLGQPNLIRLNDGDIIIVGPSGNDIVSLVSKDDGKTWTKTGTVCPTLFRGDAKLAAQGYNMNDKIFQSPTTDRIFFCQNYQINSGFFENNGDGVKRKVFCEFYYTDDKGVTWHRSDINSWDIPGNETELWFGECKILECADGSLRMYNSWNEYGCIVYSESTDNGVTWGPITKIPELYCQCSSMVFVRDPYAENDHTYYMVWVYSSGEDITELMPRSRLSLAKSTDGKEWTYICDLWRWETNYYANGGHVHINHLVNPFVYVNEKYVYVGSGASERMADDPASQTHQLQRQNIWTLEKDLLPEGKPLNNFTDVKVASDSYAAITYVTQKGLFNGTSATTFAPEEKMTRAMFVTVLGRLDKADVSKFTAPTFNDVLAGQWYTSYVEWAAANGIVNGIGGGKYGINDSVTVEQACTILARYNGSKTANATGKTVASFTDGASVSAWAKDSVEWAVANGIYNGKNGMLNPTAPATRADVAQMFANYVAVFGE